MAYRSSTPAGNITGHGGTSAPDGYLLCDGSAVSRTVYAALFASIGIGFGNGDGSTTFNLPDGRGYFMRGVDAGSGNDPDTAGRFALSGGNTADNVGSYQSHQLYSHQHNVNVVGSPGGDNAHASGGFGASGNFIPISAATGGNETRPINFYANYIIKY